MKYKDPKEHIDYLKGRIHGLEAVLEELLKTVSSQGGIRKSKFSSENKKAKLFNVDDVLRKVDVDSQIHPGTVEAALEECWHQSTSSSSNNKQSQQ